MLATRNTKEVVDAFFEILICEDGTESSGALEAQLKALGSDIRIRIAHNGFEALIQIGERCPNLLVLDLILANTNSIQMLDALQNTRFMQAMQIIVVTDLSDDAIEQLGGLHPGVTKFNKPVPFAQMLRLIRVYMDISQSR